ncbi:MAG: sphingomyelin phosphodiesterase [Paludibacter sp.]
MRKFILLIVIILLNFSIKLNATNPEISGNAMNQSSELKILSWNIYMLPFISLFNNNADRAKVIAQTLVNSDYQVIVFQEAFSSKCRSTMAKTLLQEYPYQYGPANKNHLPFRTNSGLWIVSKIPLTELGQIQFSLCKGFDAVARKGAVLFQGTFGGAKFQLLTTHLQADNLHEVRTQQCDEIRDHLLNRYYNPGIPQLICGDFNIDMDDYSSYEQMLRILDAKNGELSGNVKVTYDEINNNLARTSHGKLRVLDYVLVRNTELIHNIERKIQTFFSHVSGKDTNLSDHYAIEFSVDFGKSANNSIAQIAVNK